MGTCTAIDRVTGRPCEKTIVISELDSGIRESLCSAHALEKYNKSMQARRELLLKTKKAGSFEPASSHREAAE